MPSDAIKICHVISGDVWAGAENQAYSLIKALNTNSAVLLTAIVMNRGTLFSKLKDLGVDARIINEGSNAIPSMFWKTMKVLKEKKIDIVHTHGYKENLVAGLAGKLAGCKVVRTHHGKGMFQVSSRHNTIERLNAKWITDKMIAVSSDLRHFLTESGCNSGKIETILNGIDLSNCATSLCQVSDGPQHGRSKNWKIGIVGRLVTVKGHKYFLEAAKEIVSKRSDARFLIIGDGPLADDLQAMGADLGIADKLEFAGFYENIDDIYSQIDIFVMTSIYEGVPMALLEAMAYGKPVVVTGVGGMVELITDGENGIVIPPQNSHAAAQAVLELIDNNTLRQTVAGKAQEDVKNKYTINKTAQKTLELYLALI